MENTELEVALEELENRLERLRALYEQYFMGIERIEPSIARKDVDRRIYILRREKIRNTAKRFKLQTIISRYNTFQQYWQRICREIEQGTYKRHVIRAERIAPGQMLTIAARKRMGRAALEAMQPDERPQEQLAPAGAPPMAPRSELPPAPVLAPAGAVPAAALGGPSATTSRLAPPPKPPPKPGARPAAAPASAASAAPSTPTAPAAVKPLVPMPAVAAKPPVPAARSAFESLDLDLDFLGDWDPGSAPSKPGGIKRAPEVPARPFGKPLSRPLDTAPVPAVASGELKALPPQAPPLKLGAALPPARITRPASVPISPSRVAAAPAPAAPHAPSAPPPKAAAAALKPALPRPAATATAAPTSPAIPPRAAPPPAGARPLAPLLPGPAAPKPAPAAAAAAVTDDRVREIHARLVEAKRQTQDAASVSMEGLARSMRATEAKLREQHKNRKIDFDVVIKDGKAVLKPIVR